MDSIRRQWKGTIVCQMLAAIVLVNVAQADRPFFQARPVATPTALPVQTVAPSPQPMPLPSLPAESLTSPALSVPSLPVPSLIIEPQPTPADPLQEHITARPEQSGGSTVQLRLSEAFANRFASRIDQNQGPVRECVMGAQVSGRQTTDTNVRLEFVPSPTTARFEIALNGLSRSQTTSVTPQASLDGSSQQSFDVRKFIEFDGQQFLTRSPGVTLESHHQNHQARTRINDVPVIGSIASSIALVTANRYRPVAEMEGARRLTSRVAPELNSSVDAKLAVANQALERARAPESPWAGFFSAPVQWHTDPDAIWCDGRFGDGSAVSAAPPIDPQAGASLRIHESAVTAWLNEALPPEREFDVDELESWLMRIGKRIDREPQPTDAGGSKPTFSAPSGTMLVLGEEKPLTARFGDQKFEIEIHVAIRPPVGVELPLQSIVIAYSCRQEADRIALEPLDVKVTARNMTMLDATIGSAVQELVRSQTQARLEPISIPAGIDLPMENRKVRLETGSVRLSDGWLAIDWK